MKTIAIEGKVVKIDNVCDMGYLAMLELENGKEYYIAQNREIAGEKAREYWQDMADNDEKELACLIGEETLISWALGESAGPGYTKVDSLEDWFALWEDKPEEHFGSYDSCEYEGTICKKLMEELGFENKEVVFYRHN